MKSWSAVLLLPLPLLAAEPEPDFSAWLSEFRVEAAAQGLSAATLDAALAGLQPIPKVLELDQRQPELVEPFWTYLDKRVTSQRVERGRALMKEHAALLAEVEARHGVPAAVLVAFWGLETRYGGYLGDFPTLGALATLAYDPRRAAFFRSELLHALRILDAGDATPAEMKGSWAGAMGQMQFMPGTYRKYALDGDGDGRRNLWTSLPDAFHSAAHFLRGLGWEPGQLWGREVRLPPDFTCEQAPPGQKRRVRDWAALGVTQADGAPLPASDMDAALLLPQGRAGPAFLIYRNFEIILGWNRSNHYALTVGILADRLLGLPEPRLGRGADNRPMSRDEVWEVQSLLALAGFEPGEPDGVMGPRTREALRAYQKALGLPADGHLHLGLLELLRQEEGP